MSNQVRSLPKFNSTFRSLLSQSQISTCLLPRRQRARAPINSLCKSFSTDAYIEDETQENNLPSSAVWSRLDRCVSLLGAPVSFGQPFTGAHHAPDEIRALGLHQLISNLGWRVNEFGNCEVADFLRTRSGDVEVKGAKNCFSVGSASEVIYNDVNTILSADPQDFVLILGGDHSIPLGTLPAIFSHRPNTGIIWVDAHADINTPDSSDSGNLHGQPVGLLMDGVYQSTSELPGFQWLKEHIQRRHNISRNDVDNHTSQENNGTEPSSHVKTQLGLFRPSDIVYIGLRDVDHGEKQILAENNVKCYTMFDIDNIGIGNVMRETLEYFDVQGKDHLHLSFDIDALDPFIAPSTGTTVRGGLSFREAHFVMEAIARTKKLGSMDLVEVNPKLLPGDQATQTTQMAYDLVASALGQSILH